MVRLSADWPIDIRCVAVGMAPSGNRQRRELQALEAGRRSVQPWCSLHWLSLETVQSNSRERFSRLVAAGLYNHKWRSNGNTLRPPHF